MTSLINIYRFLAVRYRDKELGPYLKGPVAIYEYKSNELFHATTGLNPRHIYLFADIHDNRSACDKLKRGQYIEFKDLLTDTLSESRELRIDVMEETSYFEHSDKVEIKSRPSYVIHTLPVIPSATDLYTNLRYHAIDVRILFSMKRAPSTALDFMDSVVSVYRGDYGAIKENSTKLKAIINEKFVNQYITEWSKIFSPNNSSDFVKIHKQILNTPAPIRERLYKHIRKALERARADLMRATKLDYILDVVSQLFLVDLNIKSMLTDVYMLGRVFRRFADGTEAENIIINAGYDHIKNCVEFFNSVPGLDLRYSNDMAKKYISDEGNAYKDKEYQCLNIGALRRPLFSAPPPSQ